MRAVCDSGYSSVIHVFLNVSLQCCLQRQFSYEKMQPKRRKQQKSNFFLLCHTKVQVRLTYLKIVKNIQNMGKSTR